MALGVVLNRNRQVPAEDSPAFGAIAERFRRAGDLERAVALCQDGLRKFPAHTSARVTLGWALLDLGRYDEARSELEQVLKRTPDNLAAIRGLAELHDRSEHDEVAAINRKDSEWMREMAAAATVEEENASHAARDRALEAGAEPGISPTASLAAAAVPEAAADDSISALFASLEHPPVVAHVDLDAGAVVTGPVANEHVSETFAGVPYRDETPVTATAAVEAVTEAASSTFAEPTVITSPAFVTPAQAAFEAAVHAEPTVEPEAAIFEAATDATDAFEPVEVAAAEAPEANDANDAVGAVEVAAVPEPVAIIDEPVEEDWASESIDDAIEGTHAIAAMDVTEAIAAMDVTEPIAPIDASEAIFAAESIDTAEPSAPVDDPLPVAAAARVIAPVEVEVTRPVVVVAERIPMPVAETVVEPLELLPYEDPAAPDSVAVLATSDLAEFPELLPDVYVLPAAIEAARADADEGPGPWPPVIPDDPLMPAAAQAATAGPTRERPVIKALNRFLKRVETRKSTSVSEYLAG